MIAFLKDTMLLCMKIFCTEVTSVAKAEYYRFVINEMLIVSSYYNHFDATLLQQKP